jgi:type II secretory pathway component GspD/PulD (secretin)
VNTLILAVILLLFSSTLFAADEGPIVVKPRFRVFALKHISTEQAKNIIVEADLGTVSELPADNMILVTGQPRQLIKASAFLKLFDAETPVVMKAILPASAVYILPSNEQIAEEIGNMSVGSFSNPPSGIGKDKAIIDVHDDSVVVIATAEKLAAIIEAIGRSDSNGSIKQLQKETYEVQEPEPVQPKIDPVAEAELERVKAEFQKIKAELNGRNGSYESAQVGSDTNESETSVLFDKLLNSLDDAEKKIAELSPPAPNVPEPKESLIQQDTHITVPEKIEPNEPSTALKQPVEADKEIKEATKEAVKEVTKEAVKEVEKPDLTAIRKKPVAEKITTKLPSKREPNSVQKQVPVDVKEPNQVARILPKEPNTVTEVVEPNKITKVVEPVTVKGPYEPKLEANGNDTLELDMPPKINVIDLLDLVGKFLNLDYMYDPTDLTGLKGEVTLVLQGPIKIKELYPLAESVLRFKGFVMTRSHKGNLVTIVPLPKISSIDAPIVDPNDPKVKPGDVIITRIFELEHIDTASAQSLLTAMKLGVSVSPISSLGTLIVTGYAYRMERIESLLDMIDKPGEQKKFRSRELQYTTAKTLATKVKTLAEQLGTVSITISVPTPAAPARPTTPPGRRVSSPPRAPSRPTIPSSAAAPAKATVYLDADERTNRILMIGLEEQLSVVDKLIDALDVEQKDLRTLRLYEIQNVDAEEVRTKLSELGIISAGRGTTTPSRAPSRTQPTSRPVPGRPATSRPPVSPAGPTGAIQEPLTEEPQVVIIEPTNSLLVNGTNEQHIQIAIIIGYVDASQEDRQNPYVIYPLENQEPEELAGTLEKLISETITEQSGTGSKLVKTTTKTKTIEEDIIIVPDPKSYSLIVYASKKNQQWLASLIKDLDEYRPQVLLDVTLVEISKNDDFTLTLNWVSSFPDLLETSFDPAGIILPPSGGRDRFIDFDSSGTGFYGDKHINFLLNAIQTKKYGRILARPKLLVNDNEVGNEVGNIKTQEQEPIVSAETKVIPGTTAGTSSITAPSVKIDTYTAGITLEIEPHISKGDQLRLKITLSRTDFRLNAPYDFGNQVAGQTPPDLLTTDVTTVVTVPDKSTIILGGMERLNQSKGGTKIPFFGDLPFIGGLFRDTANTDTKSRLYVFVKAHILRPGEPGLKPKPMDPLKILEADEAESQRNQRIFEKRGQAIREGKGLTGTKSKVMHPMGVLELN